MMGIKKTQKRDQNNDTQINKTSYRLRIEYEMPSKGKTGRNEKGAREGSNEGLTLQRRLARGLQQDTSDKLQPDSSRLQRLQNSTLLPVHGCIFSLASDTVNTVRHLCLLRHTSLGACASAMTQPNHELKP